MIFQTWIISSADSLTNNILFFCLLLPLSGQLNGRTAILNQSKDQSNLVLWSHNGQLVVCKKPTCRTLSECHSVTRTWNIIFKRELLWYSLLCGSRAVAIINGASFTKHNFLLPLIPVLILHLENTCKNTEDYMKQNAPCKLGLIKEWHATLRFPAQIP